MSRRTNVNVSAASNNLNPADPQGHYALNILTQAAMHTSHAAARASGFQSSGREENHPNAMITNPQANGAGHPLDAAGQTTAMMDSYNASLLSSRDLDALAFNSAPHAATQHSYLNDASYTSISSELAMAHAGNLGILDAESYDDGRGLTRNQRRQNKSNKPELPFGIAEHPHITLDPPLDSGEHESGPRRKKVKTGNGNGNGTQEGEEGSKGKSRGRPRVSPKDETAADRRRTQIRMAQRAYRHRKESTISSLEKKVQDLTGTNEEMSSIFIGLYDFAVNKGLLQREPEFGQQLQATTERFLALARASAEDGHDENHDDSGKSDDHETGRRSNRRKSSPKSSPGRTVSLPEPHVSEASQSYGGYVLAKDDENSEMDLAYGQDDQFGDDQFRSHQYRRSSDIQVITRPTEENASFPFDFMDLQQYNVEVPPPEDFAHNFLPQNELLPPKTFAYNELSLSRRIHRVSNEMALRLISSDDPRSQSRVDDVFRFTLMYRTKDQVKAILKKLVQRSAKDTLQNWKAPFVHVGGSGTHFPLAKDDPNWEFIPKFGTGYSMGPFKPEVTEAQQYLDDKMTCLIPGFEGYFFDANDVEGYLRRRGLEINPAADFATIELDVLGIPDLASSPKSMDSDSTASNNSPQTPESAVDTTSHSVGKTVETFGIDFSDSNFNDIDSHARCLPFPLGFTPDWEASNAGDPVADSAGSMFSARLPPPPATNNLFEAGAKAGQNNNKRIFTVDVNVLLEEIIKKGVCLGRAPGFKPADVETALLTAVRAGSGIARSS